MAAPEIQPIANPENNPKTPDVRVMEIMALMTKKLQASLVNIIDMLQHLAIALQEGGLEANLRQEGFMEAHRLIGSLGSLGFPVGSAIEQMLTVEFLLVTADSAKLMRLICDLQLNTSDASQGHHTEVNSDSNSSCNLKLPRLMITVCLAILDLDMFKQVNDRVVFHICWGEDNKHRL